MDAIFVQIAARRPQIGSDQVSEYTPLAAMPARRGIS